MSFHFVDQIISLDPGKQATALKQVTDLDHYLIPSVKNKMVLMPSIVAEALGQLASWCVLSENNFLFRPVAGIIGEMIVLDEAPINETILLSTTIEDSTKKGMRYSATATVSGKPILTLTRIISPFLPLADFSDEADERNHFNTIYQPPLPIKFADKSCSINSQNTYFSSCDTLLEMIKGEKIIGKKNIAIDFPFFADHFSRKPVFPMSLLLESKISLMHDFLFNMLEYTPQIQFIRFTNVKMYRFITPGETVVITLQCQEKNKHCCRLQFLTEVANERASIATLECHYAQ